MLIAHTINQGRNTLQRDVKNTAKYVKVWFLRNKWCFLKPVQPLKSDRKLAALEHRL